MDDTTKVLLIGGASHLGKSSVAQLLAKQLSAKQVSTDKLARHPGRPWQKRPFVVPPHVAEHFLTLSHDQLIASVMEHRRSMWPTIESVIRNHFEGRSAERLVLEGAGLLPETVVGLKTKGVAAVWLIGDDRLQRSRIYRDSEYADAEPPAKAMIDKFLDRERRFNRIITDEVLKRNLSYVEVVEDQAIDDVARRCLERAGLVDAEPNRRRRSKS